MPPPVFVRPFAVRLVAQKAPALYKREVFGIARIEQASGFVYHCGIRETFRQRGLRFLP